MLALVREHMSCEWSRRIRALPDIPQAEVSMPSWSYVGATMFSRAVNIAIYDIVRPWMPCVWHRRIMSIIDT